MCVCTYLCRCGARLDAIPMIKHGKTKRLLVSCHFGNFVYIGCRVDPEWVLEVIQRVHPN